MQNGLKKLLRLVITVAVIFLAVRWCSSQFGSVIRLPGGSGDTGGTIGSGKGSSEESGGWFSPKKQNDRSTTNEDLIEDVEDLERELGIGKYKGQKPSTQTQTTQTPSTTTTASSPLTFKGIPVTGSLSAFGAALVKAGFKNAGNGAYTGDFAGYSGCKVTPSGNPVQEVHLRLGRPGKGLRQPPGGPDPEIRHRPGRQPEPRCLQSSQRDHLPGCRCLEPIQLARHPEVHERLHDVLDRHPGQKPHRRSIESDT